MVEMQSPDALLLTQLILTRIILDLFNMPVFMQLPQLPHQ